MSGGRLVVLDRLGRDVKRFPLEEGLATLGSDLACDIRIMLPTVSPHHATVVVHANQTVVRNVSDGETLVNGHCVSVAALRHGDVISIGGRHLRWDYSDPTVTRPQAPEPALYVGRRAGRGGRGGRAARRSGPGAAGAGAGAAGGARGAALRALEMKHRASMPGNAGGKQVAIVQPQRRDTSEHIDKNPPRTPTQVNKRPRTSKSDLDTSVNDADHEKVKRKSSARVSPKTTLSLQNTTKATLWIESRKSSPRKASLVAASKARRVTASAKKSTPLRLTVLKRAQSAQKIKVTKIQAPLKMDHTKQAAILLMTGTRRSAPALGALPASPAPPAPPARPSPPRSARSARSPRSPRADNTVTILEITDSDGRNSSLRSSNVSRRSGQKESTSTPAPPSPRKSALKDPSAKRGTRKTESIKFDLSNLESQGQSATEGDMTQQSRDDSMSDTEITLRYSESSGAQSPSPRRSIHSRSSRMLQSLGTSVAASQTPRTLTPHSPTARRATRGSMMIQKALLDTHTASHSRRSTKPAPDNTRSSIASAHRTRTLSPRTRLESYSIVDLVSVDTDDSAHSTSVYDSAGSTDITTFGTPQTSAGRRTRSTIDPTLLGSSTPYVPKTKKSFPPRSRSLNTSSKSLIDASQSTTRSSVGSRRSKSLTTPENTEDTKKHISVNSTRISRASRSRSRINESDLLLLDDDDDSPRTSRRISKASKSSRSIVDSTAEATPVNSPAQDEGACTPENTHSPEEATTPVLNIQSLLDSSQSSLASQKSVRRGRASLNPKRKTIGVLPGPKTRVGAKSKSMSFSARKTRLRLSSDSVEVLNNTDDGSQDGDVTPKSDVKLVQEAVKNKHSTAKKPQSKRSIIDDLNQSDIVKQLFNSPVKRKLSQSMTEFSQKQLFQDDDGVRVRRPTRNTIALSGRTPDNSLLDATDSYTPELFVSPISTPTHSPNLEGIKLMFAKTTPENDLRNVRGVKRLLRTPRTRRSIKNDLTNVSGVKAIFAKSPKNRLSDVRVKEVFVASPKNDLRRVSGVKSLFRSTKKQKSPRNELDDVRGVKKLFKATSPANDLRNVSGVKRTLRNHSPRNDLNDVRGVKRMFRQERQRRDVSNLSGVEQLFDESHQSHSDAETLFDRLVGKPPIKAVYSKTFSTKSNQKTRGRKSKTLHASLDVITNNVESWLEQELKKRLHKTDEASSKSANKSKMNVTRELQKLMTDTVEGNAPLRASRARNSTVVRTNDSDRQRSASELYSAHTLPIKKRSLVESSTEKAKALPLKKRAVVHSTPVKGGLHVTMNASVLGRVSPIAAFDHTQNIEQDTSIRPNQQDKETTEARPKSRRGTNKTVNLDTSSAPEFVKPSPKMTRGQAQVTSPKVKPVNPTKQKSNAPAKAQKTTPAKTIASPTNLKPNSTQAKISPTTTKASPAKIKASPAKTKTSPVKSKASPAIKKTRSAKTADSLSKTKDSPVINKTKSDKIKGSPPKTKDSPAKTKDSPAKTKDSPAKTKDSPAKTKVSPVIKKTRSAKTKDSPAKTKDSPAKTKDSPAKTKASLVIKKTRSAKTKVSLTKTLVSPIKSKASPLKVTPPQKTTRAKAKPASPIQAKATRSRRNNASATESNTKKRVATLVVAKKSPVMSPQPKVRSKRKDPDTMSSPKPSPKKTRATRKQDLTVRDKPLTPKTPKTTRARVQKATVVVSKPSPQLKPRTISTATSELQNTRKTRNIAEEKSKSPKKSQAPKKSNKTLVEESAPKTRGRKTVASESKDTTDTEPEVKPKRGRKVADETVTKTTKNKQASSAEPAKNTKNMDKQDKTTEEPKTRTRGKKETQDSEPPEPATRGRRAKQDVTTEVNTRKRKTTAPDSEIPSKVSKSKDTEGGRKKAESKTETKTETKNTRSRSAVKESRVQIEEAPLKATRGRKAAEVAPGKAQPEHKPVRGRKANIENVPANQVTGKRKRATAADPSPVKEAPKKQRGGKKSAPSPAHVSRSTRRTLKEASEPAPAGRSRRR